MDAAHRAIAKIENLAGQDIQQRNIGPLAAYTRGNLAAAAASIARHPAPSIAIITGFYLAHAEPPNCETDGPPGAALLASAFAAAGIPARIATDWNNARVVAATVAAVDPARRIPVDVIGPQDQSGGGTATLASVVEAWAAEPALTHVIAVERCGPSRDGRIRDARGVDITVHHAPLERLFAGGPWTTIGIGDLGNEIGMGSLPHELVARSVLHGDVIRCRVPCDYPIVGGISNLAAAALLAAIALQKPRSAGAMIERLKPAAWRRALEAAVRDGGAVANDHTGGPPRPQLYVDGLSWPVLEQVHQRIHELCAEAMPAQAAAEGGDADALELR